MNEEATRFMLGCRDASAPAPVLTDVRAEGRLDAVLFELTLRQTYRNRSEQVLEVVYTFPLPGGAVLLGFASELGGHRQEGLVVAKAEAERQYEEALDAGDAPVMLEAHGNGLHTANIGNLKPGEEIVLESRFAQLLAFEQGRVRVAIPTTIAPRYGQAERAGLQPQQVPLASLEAEYPLALSLTLGEALAGAAIDCPTHRFTTQRRADGTVRLDLEPGARMDRDAVVLVAPREACPSLVVRADDAFDRTAPIVLMAAMQPASAPPRERIALKLLVDCSGSMSGDSIDSARAALRGVVAGLGESDQLSLTRFGSTVHHLAGVGPAGPRALERLQALIAGIQADLGGTEMQAALHAVFALRHGREFGQADVLLITDGEVWQVDPMIAAAKRSGHRVFAIGVGSSPAEDVLRRLAESTGGACEFATPGEALEAAARRMLDRMRQPRFTNARIEWGGTPAWVSGPGACLFGGDTVIALAGFRQPVVAGGIRLLADDAQGRPVELARIESEAPCPGDSLARIAAARRIRQPGDLDVAALALRYQLMSDRTHCVLVHRRAEGEQADEPAALHRVASMMPAGWGGLGSVEQSMLRCSISPAVMDMDASWSLAAAPAAVRPAPLAKAAVRQRQPHLSHVEICTSVRDHLVSGGQPGSEGLAAVADALPLAADVRQAIDEVAALGLDRDRSWLLLAHWIVTRPDALVDFVLPGLLQQLVAAIDPALANAATQIFDRVLGRAPGDGPPLTRMQRLKQALARTAG